jgi:hypothetical protein
MRPYYTNRGSHGEISAISLAFHGTRVSIDLLILSSLYKIHGYAMIAVECYISGDVDLLMNHI